MLVDPEVLRAFAGQVDIAASAIAAANIGPTTTSAADGIADSTTQWAAPTVGEHFSRIADQLEESVTKMGQAVRGAGDQFEDSALFSQGQ